MSNKSNQFHFVKVHDNGNINENDLKADKKPTKIDVDPHDMPCACNSNAGAATTKPPIVININHPQLSTKTNAAKATTTTTTTTTNFNVNHQHQSVAQLTDAKASDRTSTHRPKNSKRSASVVNHINICINNNFKSETEQRTMADDGNSPAPSSSMAPDDDADDDDDYEHYYRKSPTPHTSGAHVNRAPKDVAAVNVGKAATNGVALQLQQCFNIGDEVLVKTTGDRFALGIIGEFVKNHCLVKFDNDTEKWAPLSSLEKFCDEDGDVMAVCVGCKDDTDPDEVIPCKICERGLHEKCRSGVNTELNGVWYCSKCRKESGFTETPQRPKPCRRTRRDSILIMPTKVDLYFQWISQVNSLTWDKHHRINKEQKYCYCSRNGKWYMQMIQCNRCHQWFHENCVQILTYPLYCGDRFYVFICLKCNPKDGEFIRRIKIDIENTAHLLLYSLTMQSSRRFFNFSKVIVPYAIDNWHLLQLPPCTSKWSNDEIGKRIGKALKSNRKLFQYREVAITESFGGHRLEFGLVESLPPDIPNITLPASTVPPENFIKNFILTTYGLRLLPKCSNTGNSRSKIQNSDSRTRNLMTGIKYVQLITYDESNVALNYENSDSGTDSDFEGFVSNKNRVQMANETVTAAVAATPATTLSQLAVPRTASTAAGVAVQPQRSPSKDQQHQQSDVYEFKIADDPPPLRRKRGRPPRVVPTLQPTVPPPIPASTAAHKDNTMPNSIIAGCSTSSSAAVVDLTHDELLAAFAMPSPCNVVTDAVGCEKTSIDGATTAKPDDQSNTTTDDKKDGTVSPASHLVDFIDLCDSGDEMIVRGSTLDLIIPPPKNFNGCNNPFLSPEKGDKPDAAVETVRLKQNHQPPRRTMSSSSSSNSSVSSGNNNQPLSLFGNRNFKKGQFCVVRTVKRRLNASDIVIGPNMEVKRRKNRRRSSTDQVEVIRTSTIPYTKYLSKEVQIARASSKGPSSTSASTSSSASSTPVGTLNAPFASLAAAATAVATNRPVGQTMFGNRRLRKRGAKNYAENKMRNPLVAGAQSAIGLPSTSGAVPSATASSSANVSATNLLTEYFGAANRILNGEKFVVLGKRVLIDGTTQYLIQWQDMC